MAISAKKFFGGSDRATLAGNTRTLQKNSERVQYLTSNTGVSKVLMPDARRLKEGGPQFYVVSNADSLTNIQVKDQSDTTLLATLTPGQMATAFLLDNSTADGVWIVSVGGVFTPTVPDEVFFDGTMSIGVANDGDVNFENVVDLAASMVIGTDITADLQIQSPPSLDLFNFTWDGGTFSEWSITNQAKLGQPHGMEAIVAAAMGGTTEGVRVSLTAGSGADFFSEHPINWTTETLRLRFYLDADGLDIVTANEFSFVRFESATANRKIDLKLTNDAGTLKIFAEVHTDAVGVGEYEDTTWYAVGTGANYWEFEFKRSSDNATSDATVQVWKNGTSQGTDTLGEPWFDEARPIAVLFGAPGLGTSDINTNSTFDFDEFRCNESGNLIGAVGENPEDPFAAKLAIGMGNTASLDVSGGVAPTTNIVSPNASASGGGDGSVGDPWNLKEGQAASGAGIKVTLRGGLYPEHKNFQFNTDENAIPDGGAGNHAVYESYPGETPILQGQMKYAGVNNVDIKGIEFEADVSGSGSRWVGKSTGVSHLRFINCAWDSTGESNTYVGGHFEGNNISFIGCQMGTWRRGDAFLFNESSEVLIQECFANAPSNHSIFSIENTKNFAVDKCFFRNPADRVLTINFKFNATTAGEYGVVQKSVFFDSDFTPNQNFDFSPNGANMSVRYSVRKCIVRWNVFVGGNYGKQRQAYVGAMWLGCFNDKDNANLNTLYGNVIYNNRGNGLLFKRNTSTSPEASVFYGDNWVFNNIIYGNEHFQIRAWDDDSDIDDPTNGNGWTIENNLLGHPNNTAIYAKGATGGETTPDAEEEYTKTQAEAAFAGWNNNIQDTPIFRDKNLYKQYDIDEGGDPTGLSYDQYREFINAYKNNGGPAVNAGRHVCKVTADNTPSTTTFEVDRSYALFDGHGMFDPDQIIVKGPVTGEVTATLDATSGVGTNGTTITVQANITVREDDLVYLAESGVTPDIGMPAAI